MSDFCSTQCDATVYRMDLTLNRYCILSKREWFFFHNKLPANYGNFIGNVSSYTKGIISIINRKGDMLYDLRCKYSRIKINNKKNKTDSDKKLYESG